MLNMFKRSKPIKSVRRDTRIEAGVESALLAKGIAELPEHKLEVTVQDGIVNLAGTLPHLQILRQAITAAESIAGVRAVVAEAAVEPEPQPDPDVHERVRRALERDAVTRRFDIRVKVADGYVALEGVVDSWGAAGICEDVASSVNGVRQVENRLSVKHGNTRRDEEIAAEIRESLDFDSRVDSRELAVSVDEARVTVKGCIRFPLEKRFISQHAWSRGVRFVDLSGLKVVYPRADGVQDDVKVNDEQIVKAVNDAMAHDARVHYFQVEVLCSEGHVTLEGEVEDFRAKRAAAQDASHTMGVKEVTNRLVVHPKRNHRDEDLRQEANILMAELPFASSAMDTFKVENGQIFLTGKAKDRHILQAAVDRLATLEGIIDIRTVIE